MNSEAKVIREVISDDFNNALQAARRVTEQYPELDGFIHEAEIIAAKHILLDAFRENERTASSISALLREARTKLKKVNFGQAIQEIRAECPVSGSISSNNIRLFIEKTYEKIRKDFLGKSARKIKPLYPRDTGPMPGSSELPSAQNDVPPMSA